MAEMFINLRPMLLVLPLVALMSCKKDAVTPGVQADCPEEDHLVGYPDQDGDGFGVAEGRITPCSVLPRGYTDNSADCDDDDPDVHPDAEEVCDEIDNDCDFETDEDAIDQRTFYRDNDADGHGDDDDNIKACDLPDGYVIGVGTAMSPTRMSTPARQKCATRSTTTAMASRTMVMRTCCSSGTPTTKTGMKTQEPRPAAPEGTTGSPSDCDDTDPTTHLPQQRSGWADNDCDGTIDEDDCE